MAKIGLELLQQFAIGEIAASLRFDADPRQPSDIDGIAKQTFQKIWNEWSHSIAAARHLQLDDNIGLPDELRKNLQRLGHEECRRKIQEANDKAKTRLTNAGVSPETVEALTAARCQL